MITLAITGSIMVSMLFILLILFLLLFFLQKAILYLSFLPKTSTYINSWVYFLLGLFLPTSGMAGLIYYLYCELESPAEYGINDNDQWVAAGAAAFVMIVIFLVLILVVNLSIWMKLATLKLKELTAKAAPESPGTT
jgi:hypothetical protein